MTIFGQVKKEIESFEHSTLDMNPSYASTQKDIIDLVDFYWASKYKDGNIDALGFLKPFYNVIINPTEVAMKMIDLDTKDIKIVAEDGQSYYPAWLFGKELKLWMKEQKIGQLLNKIVYVYPKYGTVVLKKSGKKIDLVPLQNLINKPDAEKLTDGLIIEEHEEPVSEFSERGWENIELALERNGDDYDITYYEVYGDIEDENYPDNNYFIVTDKGVIVHWDKIDSPYKELHWDRLPGRWLGRGQVERLFEAQIQSNKISHYKDQSLHWTSKRVWQTRDTTVKKNLMTDIENGDILKINSEIIPVSTEERNLHAYREEEQRWDALIDKLGFSFDVIRGERSPAGTPLGSAILQTRMAGGFFDLKREDLGLFLKEVLFEWIIPEFEKTINKEHKIMLGEFDEEELTKLRNLILTNKTNKAIVNYVTENGKIPSRDEIVVIKGVVGEKLKTEKDIKIPKGYYDNLKYKIDIIITNEQIDLASKMSTLQTVLQIIGSNPTILQDPNTKKVFYQLLDLAGINPVQFETEEAPLEETLIKAQVGGSIAKAPPIAAPVAGMEARTL